MVNTKKAKGMNEVEKENITVKSKKESTKKGTKKVVKRGKTKVDATLNENDRRKIVMEHITQLIQLGQKQGCLTYTEIMNVMEEDDLNPEQIDKMYEVFADKGIDIVGEDTNNSEHDALDEEAENTEQVPDIRNVDLSVPDGINIDDPVRMYLKEIGRVPLFCLLYTSDAADE